MADSPDPLFELLMWLGASIAVILGVKLFAPSPEQRFSGQAGASAPKPCGCGRRV